MEKIIKSYIENRANAAYNKYKHLPAIFAELRKTFGAEGEQTLEVLKNIVKLQVLLHPEWTEQQMEEWLVNKLSETIK